jgi:hypothetical protein
VISNYGALLELDTGQNGKSKRNSGFDSLRIPEKEIHILVRSWVVTPIASVARHLLSTERFTPGTNGRQYPWRNKDLTK